MSSRVIGNFPIPFERELLDHTIARAFGQTYGMSTESKNERLWGKDYRINDFIPKYLVELSSRLGGLLTPERIYSENTIFPFYNLFMPAGQQQNFEKSYLGREAIPMLRWPKTPGFSTDRIRYCPLCVKEQGLKPYPRVEWQLPGIDVCFRHHCFLEQYPLDKDEKGRPQYTVMKRERLSTKARYCTSKPLNKLADLAAELFNYPLLVYGRHDLLLRIDTLLKTRGYFGYVAQYIRKLYDDLEAFYSRETLEELGAVIEDFRPSYNWLGKILSDSSASVSPVCWLLLIGFLSPDIYSLLKLTPAEEDYSKCYCQARRSCPNPVCPDHGSASSLRLLSMRYNSVTHRIREIYRCEKCQMVYSVINGRVARKLQYGPLWFKVIGEKVENGATDSDLMREFGITLERALNHLQKEDFTPFDTKINRLRDHAYKYAGENDEGFCLRGFSIDFQIEYDFLLNNDSVWIERTFPRRYQSELGLVTQDIRMLSSLQIAAYLLRKKGVVEIIQADLINQVEWNPIYLTDVFPRTNNYIRSFPEKRKSFKLKNSPEYY